MHILAIFDINAYFVEIALINEYSWDFDDKYACKIGFLETFYLKLTKSLKMLEILTPKKDVPFLKPDKSKLYLLHKISFKKIPNIQIFF